MSRFDSRLAPAYERKRHRIKTFYRSLLAPLDIMFSDARAQISLFP
jgi:hypothetical protein